MSTRAIPATDRVYTDRRPLPQNTDYLGKGRVAACVAKRRYNLVTHDNETRPAPRRFRPRTRAAEKRQEPYPAAACKTE